MAITTLDGVLAGCQPPISVIKGLTGTLVSGRPHSTFYTPGNPGAANLPTPGLSGTNLTTYAGQIPFTNPVSGNTYLARMSAIIQIPCQVWLCDRLWHNSGINITSTSEQLFTGSQQILARDRNGVTSGHGVMVGVEVTSATGAGTPTLTVNYNNTLGVSAVGVGSIATVASSIQGTFHPIGLAAGDVGVSKVNSITLGSSWSSGSISVVAYRIITRLDLPMGSIPNSMDCLTGGFPRLYDNSVPFLVILPNTTTTSTLSTQLVFAQG